MFSKYLSDLERTREETSGGQVVGGMEDLNWLFNVTIKDISVIYVTAHRCAGGLKKLDLRSGSHAIDIS